MEIIFSQFIVISVMERASNCSLGPIFGKTERATSVSELVSTRKPSYQGTGNAETPRVRFQDQSNLT
jgi:hypothetical protein